MPADGVRLRRCDVLACEAMCCYDGAYLGAGEEARLSATVREHPGFFAFLPEPFVVDGDWLGRLTGRKTAVRPHAYRNPAYPAHFSPTRCVFAFPDGRCSLQILAVQLGEHPWARKPAACWRHPLRDGPSGLEPPPATHEADPDRVPGGYPGFVTYTACGRDRPDGEPWQEACAPELRYYAERRGSRGLSPGEIGLPVDGGARAHVVEGLAPGAKRQEAPDEDGLPLASRVKWQDSTRRPPSGQTGCLSSH